MSVNLDLGDPVLITCDIIADNFSSVPVTVATGAVRGGYLGKEGKVPVFNPIEGKAGRKRVASINVHKIPSKVIGLVYEVSYVETESDRFGTRNDITSRVSIDMRMALTKAKLLQLDHEVRRIIMIYRKTSPGGNWDYIKLLDRKDLTDKSKGLFRYVRDIEFIKVCDYVGHQ